jgi:hypothetical protein
VEFFKYDGNQTRRLEVNTHLVLVKKMGERKGIAMKARQVIGKLMIFVAMTRILVLYKSAFKQPIIFGENIGIDIVTNIQAMTLL